MKYYKTAAYWVAESETGLCVAITVDGSKRQSIETIGVWEKFSPPTPCTKEEVEREFNRVITILRNQL